MFKKNTVFILGAGASYEYGYPLGNALKRNIIAGIKSINFDDVSAHLKGEGKERRKDDFIKDNFYNPLIYFIWSNIKGFDQKDEFYSSLVKVETFQEFSEKLEDQGEADTIDLFIEKNPSFVKIGKLFISLEILKCTLDLSKKELSQGNIKVKQFRSDGWLCSFVKHYLLDARSNNELREQNLRIITFNYDKSVEYYFDKKMSSSEIHKDFSWRDAIEIKHVYGQVELEEVKRNNLSQDMNSLFGWNIFNQMENIRLIGERKNSSDLETMKKWIKDASKVFILGFGYSQDNMDVLGLTDFLKSPGKFCCPNYQNNLRIQKTLNSYGVQILNIHQKELKDFIDDAGIFYDN